MAVVGDLGFADTRIYVLQSPVAVEIRRRKLARRDRLLDLCFLEDVPPSSFLEISVEPIGTPGNMPLLPPAATRRLFWAAWVPGDERPPGPGEASFLQIPGHGLALQPAVPQSLNASLPVLAEVDGTVQLHLTVVDRFGNPTTGYSRGGVVMLSDGRRLAFPTGDLVEASCSLSVPLAAPGTLRAVARAPGLRASESNPLLVQKAGSLRGLRLWVGDAQVHTVRSDGSLPLAEYVWRIRRSGTCDWVAFTDHDRLHPFPWDDASWERQFALLDRLATKDLAILPAYEWTRRPTWAPGRDEPVEGHH
jgi:hypothetical protein